MGGRCEIAAVGKAFRTNSVPEVTHVRVDFLGDQYFDAHTIQRASGSALGLQ